MAVVGTVTRTSLTLDSQLSARAKGPLCYCLLMPPFPLVIVFAKGSTIERQAAVVPKLPIVQNGPPGTFVLFATGQKLPLPTDQIVHA